MQKRQAGLNSSGTLEGGVGNFGEYEYLQVFTPKNLPMHIFGMKYGVGRKKCG